MKNTTLVYEWVLMKIFEKRGHDKELTRYINIYLGRVVTNSLITALVLSEIF